MSTIAHKEAEVEEELLEKLSHKQVLQVFTTLKSYVMKKKYWTWCTCAWIKSKHSKNILEAKH